MEAFMTALTGAGTSIVGYVSTALAAGLVIGIAVYGAKRAWGAFKSIR